VRLWNRLKEAVIFLIGGFLVVPSDGVEFNHVMVYVSDVSKSLNFYQGLLGFDLLEKSENYARLKSPSGRSTIALHRADDVQAGKGITLYFETRNLDKFCNSLSRKGANFTQMPKVMPWGWKHAYLSDPDGYTISLYWAGPKRLKISRQK
jgi:catechol 2,3-dioxygenase